MSRSIAVLREKGSANVYTLKHELRLKRKLSIFLVSVQVVNLDELRVLEIHVKLHLEPFLLERDRLEHDMKYLVKISVYFINGFLLFVSLDVLHSYVKAATAAARPESTSRGPFTGRMLG